MKCKVHRITYLKKSFKLLVHPDGFCNLSGHYFGQLNKEEQLTMNKSVFQHVNSIAKMFNNIK